MKFSLRTFFWIIFFSTPFFVFADVAGMTYQPLQSVKMPNGGDFYNANILEYLANIYILAIALAGGLAVVRIVYAGIKYMTSDIYGLKTQAKKDINAAVVGLLMILGIYIFLYTLNPNLVKMHLQIQPTKMIQGSGVDEFTWYKSDGNAVTVPIGKGGTVGTESGTMLLQILKGAQFANPDWNAYALEQIRSSGILDLPVPDDAGMYFPGGIPSAEGYLSIMAAIAQRESGGQAAPPRYLETKIGDGTKYSVGLMSLTPGDRGTGNMTYEDLENPYNNIRVAVGLMQYLIKEDGTISGNSKRGMSRYWSTIR